jgi:hypothetical protein
MCHLITFTSAKFDVSSETPNPINPIAGESVLTWLRDELRSQGRDVTSPEAEDWGWYVYVRSAEGTYLVGASSDVDEPEPREWTIQICRERSALDKLLGRNKLNDVDALSLQIEGIIRRGAEAQGVQVDRRA